MKNTLFKSVSTVAILGGLAVASAVPAQAAVLPGAVTKSASTIVVGTAVKSIKKTVQTNTGLNVRKGTNAKTSKLGTLSKGTKVTATGQDSKTGWYRITYKNKTGYISNKYVRVVSTKVSSTPVRKGDRWAKSNQPYYATATSKTVKGYLKKDKKYWWNKWDSKNRRDLISVSGKWVWTGPTNTKAPSTKQSGSSSPVTSKAKVKTFYNKSISNTQYSVIDGGVNWSKTVGAVIYLDGDYYTRGYSQSISEHPNGAKAKAMAKEAAAKNKVLVIPRIPASSYVKSMGYTWWYKPSATVGAVRAVDAKIRSTLGIGKNQIVYMGYSGGAEYITYQLARTGQSNYGYQGAILLAGGGGRSGGKNLSVASNNDFRKNFDIHWFVGSKDGTGQSMNAQTWSAFTASSQGQSLYNSKGYTTSRTVLSGQDHHSYNLASILKQGLAKVK